LVTGLPTNTYESLVVIPEPTAIAAILGLFAFACALLRYRSPASV
jgi:hypothetical protein